MEKYIVYDGINNEYHHCDTIENAREIVEETIYQKGEGYHPDHESVAIYKLAETVNIEYVDNWIHEFVPHK